MKLRAALLATVQFFSASASFAAGVLVSGPMLGYAAHRETLVWVETKGAKEVALRYWLAGQPATAQGIVRSELSVTPAGGQIVKFRPGLLEQGATYEYAIEIDGLRQTFPYPLRFKTRPLWEWRAPPPDFRFIFGSCAYLNEAAYDRPGAPYGKGTEIFRHMAASGADFMIWGGDNWYYREPDFDSFGGLWYRVQHDRATPDLQALFAAMNHYATWDDHDYGCNDSNKSFELKDESLRVFEDYWGNATYGQAGHPGVYSKFFWGDAAFILMDNRWYRDDTTLDEEHNPGKTQYGAHQLDWLKQSLLEAQVLKPFTFKFVVTGGQMLTDFGGASETFAYYKQERSQLLQFIRDQHITGVVFLTGDVHFTELARAATGSAGAIYELTSSPFTSSVWTGAATVRSPEPQRVPGTLVVDQNYCVLAIHGPRDERVLTITCYDKTNAKRWSHDIPAAELR
jgi:alkaline phosphatase D